MKVSEGTALTLTTACFLAHRWSVTPHLGGHGEHFCKDSGSNSFSSPNKNSKNILLVCPNRKFLECNFSYNIVGSYNIENIS